MNNELLEHCKKEIEDLLIKGLIRKSKSPWSCAAFYINKQAKLERGVPRLVIVRLNLFNHVLTLFHAKFACNLAIRYPVFM